MLGIVTLQLTPAEMQVVEGVCRTDGHTIRALTPTALQELVAMPTACLIAAAHDDDELRTVRRAIANAPQHWYAVGAPVGARQLMCSIVSHPEVLPFFLPPLADEFRITLRRLSERHLQHQRHAHVVAGTEALDHRLSWRSADVVVSAVARYVAQLLQQAGFYGDQGDVDQVALSLEEALTNALEHGNLELDSALRHTPGKSGDAYEELRAARLDDAAYGGRPLTVVVRLATDRATVTVTDVGAGFDTASAEGRLAARRRPGSAVSIEEVGAGSGKGFELIARWFDDVALTEGGRQIVLTRLRAAGSA